MRFISRLLAEIKIRCLPEVITCIVYIFLFIIGWIIIQLSDYPLTTYHWQAYIFEGW